MSRRRSKRQGRNDEVLPAIAEPEPRVPRRLRVEGELSQALAVALRQLRDPRVSAVNVTRVQMTDDLQHARVFVRLGGVVEPEAARADKGRDELMRGLKAATNRVRRLVGAQLALRYAPELRFTYDTGVDAAARVDELLGEIGREDAQRGAVPPGHVGETDEIPNAEQGDDDDQGDEEMV
jgi:ribosome-binding factor A